MYKKNVILACIMSLTIFITQNYSVMANTVSSENTDKISIDELSDNEYKDIIESNQDSVTTIEEEMEKDNTSIDEQIDKFLEEDLKYFSPEEAQMVRDRMISMNALKYKTKAVFPDDFKKDAVTISDLAVARAAIAYFKYKNYYLSAHLLSRALSVKSDAEYQPSNELKNFLYNTEAYKALSNKKKYPDGRVHGKAYFQNRYNRDEADAYYAIHQFTATMTHNRVKITDKYDFDEKIKYINSATQEAVNALYRLQQKKILTAYHLRIHLVR